VGFASAYRELHAMKALGLVTSERADGAEVFRANDSHPLADALRQLVAAPTRLGDDDDARCVRGQLVALGAPLQADAEALSGTIDEAIVRGVHLAHRDPSVARALPVCLYRLRETLDPESLRRHAIRFGEKRALGFFLDLTTELSGDRRFAAWAKPLRDQRCTASRDFFHIGSQSRRHQRLAYEKTPRVARRWGLRMNTDVEAFRSMFRKFVHAA